MGIDDMFSRFRKVEPELISEVSCFLDVPLNNNLVISDDEIYGPSVAWAIAKMIIDGERKQKMLKDYFQNLKTPINSHNGQH